ncbi:hypothetical protein DICPUDRAFT_98444 [Dictyostelium purpureum]|uniref:Uncharacterized protein n=1 Tax=Dictyostelium purpureum TaxID=5786 RepID=F0ZQE7_DICPU|nr:uncharacterized protein DICPUDRAFT_98444 [Dictyostelium purpureum]EGC33815.1 hypothetical protein DICPUDRAFT_98444 [Dictyostelium purpureum]|eukprot:XP_003289641.1 hypothetical protein DICPUDRAFT_98444 [Dictyostelium purpureum]
MYYISAEEEEREEEQQQEQQQQQQQQEKEEEPEMDLGKENENNESQDIIDNDAMLDENYMKRESEFFGFHPFSFIDDVHESAHDYCADSADFIESCLLGHPLFSNKQEYKDVIQEGTDKVWGLLEEIFTNNLNKYEEYLISDIFNIPSDLILPHENSNLSASKPTKTTNSTAHLYNKSINILDKELEDLRTNIQKLTNDNSNNKIKMQNLENDIGLLKSIDSNLSTDFNNIENINMINQQRKILDYNYQVLKSNNDNNNNDSINNNNSNKQTSISVQKSILDRMNDLNINETDQANNEKEIKSIEVSNQLFERISNKNF